MGDQRVRRPRRLPGDAAPPAGVVGSQHRQRLEPRCSLTLNSDPAFPYHKSFGPVYPASKTAMNAMSLAMMTELADTSIKVRICSPAFTKTNLNGYAGIESVEDGSREVVRVALLGPDDPSGTWTRWE